ncbi:MULTISPECIES: site-specific integrase [Pseudoalteromonas]|uniref:Integrase n=1 Tax=Pseudoalteromonas gelatinilytica TaxID=1703256 RepID=A0ABQ1UDH6_9GAMM|nr:site-specific integrase [Pseudoalteromonas profundi]GGF14799.1 integrase [Pseudoalteromonas profundi]
MAELIRSFTDQFISNLQVKKYIQIYADKHHKHLKLQVRPSGKKSYFFRAKCNGKDIKRKIGEVGQITVPMAKVLADKTLRELRHSDREFEIAEQYTPSKYITINNVFELYKANELDYRKTIAGRTHALEVAYNTHVKKQIGDCFVVEISKKFARSFLKEIEPKGYSAHNKVISVLKAAFNYVIDYEEQLGISVNPFERMKKMQSIARNRYLSYEEAGRLLNALSKVSDQDVADIYRIALFTGARLSNVKSMQWADLNLSSAIWLIPATLTKTRQQYEIPLHKAVLEILRARKSRGGSAHFVFPARNKSKYGYITGGDKIWKEAITLAGLYHENPNIRPRPHDLRRTFATWQIQSGADISVVSKALCHTSLKHTLIYAHTNMDQVRSAIEGAFEGITYSFTA